MNNRLELLDELKGLEKKKQSLINMIDSIRIDERKIIIDIKIEGNLISDEAEIRGKFKAKNTAILKYLNLELDETIKDISLIVNELY